MKLDTIILIIVLSIIVWQVWLWWLANAPKRKNEEKSKRKNDEYEDVIGEVWEVEQSSSLWYGHSTLWMGGDEVNLLELEFGQGSLDRINEAIDRTDETNTKLQEAIQHMKDIAEEYEIYPLSELMEDQSLIDTKKVPVPTPAENPPSSTEMTK